MIQNKNAGYVSLQDDEKAPKQRPPPRKLSLTDPTNHPHLYQIHEALHNLTHDIKDSYAQYRERRHEKRPQDGKTNPME